MVDTRRRSGPGSSLGLLLLLLLRFTLSSHPHRLMMMRQHVPPTDPCAQAGVAPEMLFTDANGQAASHIQAGACCVSGHVTGSAQRWWREVSHLQGRHTHLPGSVAAASGIGEQRSTEWWWWWRRRWLGCGRGSSWIIPPWTPEAAPQRALWEDGVPSPRHTASPHTHALWLIDCPLTLHKRTAR